MLFEDPIEEPVGPVCWPGIAAGELELVKIVELAAVVLYENGKVGEFAAAGDSIPLVEELVAASVGESKAAEGVEKDDGKELGEDCP